MADDIRITPSILNADRENLEYEIARISDVSDLIHLDIMDNEFVPNFTWDFASAQEIIRKCPIGIDAHLMIADVDRIAVDYALAGAASVTIHAEAAADITKTLREIRAHGARSGLAVKPATKIEDYLDLADDVDMFLIMTVEPGFGGQSFMVEMLEKVKSLRKALGKNERGVWLQVDGGISPSTIQLAAEAGADTFVAGSAVYKSDDPAQMVEHLRKLATK